MDVTQIRAAPEGAPQENRYINAARTRIFVAQFRRMHSEFNSAEPDGQLIEYAAQAGRAHQQSERIIAAGRILPFLIGVAVIFYVLLAVADRGAVALFDSHGLGIFIAILAALGYLRGPSMLVDRKSRWPSAVSAVIAIVFASPLVTIILELPGAIPANDFLKWFIFIAGIVAIGHLLASAFEIIWWPLFGHRGAWLSRTVTFEPTLFQQLVHSSFLIQYEPDVDVVMESIHDAGETARAVHMGLFQQGLEAGGQDLLKKRGEKIAATIWHHNYLYAMPGYDDRNVARSLFNGAMSIYGGNWDNLCQIDPHVSVKSRLRRYASRVLWAAAITAAAFVLPTTDILPADQAMYVRATLLLTAFFALFSSDTTRLRETALSLTKDTLGKSK